MPRMSPDNIGDQVATIPVELSTRFLEHFSEQLYSSPQKAFEELISNGWDAGADIVDVRVGTDLSAADATLAVFDNGASMDLQGLRDLWRMAFSPKEGRTTEHGRPLIGKFGIGKLATYVLAERLTYICKAHDGVIRRVTMNYGEVDTQEGAKSNRLINNLELDVFEIQEQQLEQALTVVHDGTEILKLLRQQSQAKDNEGKRLGPEPAANQEEFGGQPADLQKPQKGTWTLVVLSHLKPAGRELRLGILRRMLASALPFGSEMAIDVNGERLLSTKTTAPQLEDWIIGPNLKIEYVNVNESDNTSETHGEDAPEPDADSNKKLGREKIAVDSGTDPYPYIDLPEIGRVTGRVRLFENKITGGKSDERGASNGFHINVLGRIVNQHDPNFGEANLNHAAWARFRMTVRADGLNRYLTTNREQFKECEALRIFRAFLRRVFNLARNCYDSDINAVMPDGGDVLVQSLGVISLNPLRSVVSETLRTTPAIPGLFDDTGIQDRDEKRHSWRENTADNIKNALGQVKYEKLTDNSFVKFRIADSSVVVNKDHPFVAEHSHSKAEKELLRTVAMIGLLTDVYALDIGIQPRLLESVRAYRDRLMRFKALQRRQSGVLIAKLLKDTQHDSAHSERLEAAVSDALRYLGFDVEDLAKPGEPEGLARAFATPTDSKPTRQDPRPPLYSFSFDAKSSKHKVAKTGNISLDAVLEHRERHKADHALVIAPGFSAGALPTRCQELRVTPMTAEDLGRLLQYTVEYGAIPVTKLRELFQYFDPKKVSLWVTGLAIQLNESRTLTIDVFIKALEALKGKVPDALAASLVAFTCRETLGVVEVQDADVISLARGLQVLVPDLIGVDDDKIAVSANSTHVAAAIRTQLDRLHGDDDGE